MRMKRRLYRSRDSLLDEILPHKSTHRVCGFGDRAQQKSRTRKVAAKRSIIRLECPQTILIAEPEEVFFHNFEYNKVYKKTVLVKNVSNSMARYKIERRSPYSKFAILFDTGGVETMKIAPGMSIKLTVSFMCNVIEDPEESLIVNVEGGKTVCVKLRGYRDPPLLRAVGPSDQICSRSFDFAVENCSSSFLSVCEEEREHEVHEEQLPKTRRNLENHDRGDRVMRGSENLGANFECGKCFVGERIVVARKFVNEGGDGTFFIMSEIDWCTMNIGDVMDCNMILIPPFAIWPMYFTLHCGQAVDISTYFFPESYGMQVDKLYILCNNLSVQSIELVGDGVLYDRSFIRLSDNVCKNSSPFPGSDNGPLPHDQYQLNMGEIGPDETRQTSILVTNASELKVYFRWEKHSRDRISRTNNMEHLPIRSVMIEPAEGSLSPDSKTSFGVIVQANDLQTGEYHVSVRLYVEDIPFAAIPKDCDLTIAECLTKRRNCPITMDVLVADIEVCVRCIGGKHSPDSGICQEAEEKIRCTNEAEEVDNLNDRYSSSSSVTGTENIHKGTINDPLICGTDDVDAVANVLVEPESNGLLANVAILIPESPLYVGIEETFSLTLRNLTCEPVSYAWGRSPDSSECKMEVHFKPERGSIVPPANTAAIEMICLPKDTGIIEDFFIPCFIGSQDIPAVMLGIECTVDSLDVTFLFLPPPNAVTSPCFDETVRVEWHKDGHTSALNLNNLNMSQSSKLVEEKEVKTIDLDAGQVVKTAAVGPRTMRAENVSVVSLPETVSAAKREHKKDKKNTPRSQSAGNNTARDKTSAEFDSNKVDSPVTRSWENLLRGIVWSDDRPDEFISLKKPEVVVPFYKTIVPPVIHDLAIEFIDLPLRTDYRNYFIVAKRTFVIRNETLAESKFVIKLKQFGPTKRVKALNPKETIDLTYANVMGGRSENYWEEIKPPGRGVVLVIEPKSGNLAPQETVPIDIYVYADTWGVYVDEVTVSIIGLPDYVFGVCIQIIGSPIEYPISKHGINRIPVLRFGALALGGEDVTRKILIENTSSIIIAVNWYSFLTDPVTTEDSIPFNIILRMFSPFTNEIANGQNETAMYSDEFGSGFTSSTTFETDSSLSDYCYRSECCPPRPVSPRQVSTQEKEAESEISDGTDNPAAYSTESEIESRNLSENTVDKDTELGLTLTRYYGEPDFSMFKVTPEELIIPGKEKRWIEITLNTKSFWDKFGMQDGKDKVDGRLIGFVQVAPMHKYKADCYSRDDGCMLAPTEIRLEAGFARPMLSHVITESDRTFTVFASSMFTYFRKRIKIRRRYLFHNNERKVTLIKVQSSDPFQVLGLTLSTQNSVIDPLECESIAIAPENSIEVDVICSIDASWIDKAMEIGKYRTPESLYVETKRSLVIDHVGSCSQVIPLFLRIYFPLVNLSTNRIEFGTVCIGDSKRIVLSIENISSLYCGTDNYPNVQDVVGLISSLFTIGEKQILNIRGKKENNDFQILPNHDIIVQEKDTLDVVVIFIASAPHKSVEVIEIFTAVPNYSEECILEGYGNLDQEYTESGE